MHEDSVLDKGHFHYRHCYTRNVLINVANVTQKVDLGARGRGSCDHVISMLPPIITSNVHLSSHSKDAQDLF